MIKDLKWITTFFILLISLGVFFGGWYVYQKVWIKDPILGTVADMEGVKIEDVFLDKEKVDLFITLKPVEPFQTTYQQIESAVQPYLKNRKLTIHFNNQGNEQLLKAWNTSYFKIAEAIDQKQYSMIPQTIDSMKNVYHLDDVGYSMDDKYIYIDLHQGKSSLYYVLPRYSGLEVKNVG